MTKRFQFDDIGAYRQQIAPEGALRVGLYRGSPSSYDHDPASGESRGVGYMIGRCLAEHLGIPIAPCVFDSNSDVLSAMKSHAVDLMFTNATAARKEFISFAPVLLEVGKSILAPTQSPLHALAELRDRSFRIGFSKGSTTGTEFKTIFPLADVVAVDDLGAAASFLQAGSLDGFATNMAILFKLASSVPDCRMLTESWGKEQYALGIPIARAAAQPLLTAFTVWLSQSGNLELFIKLSGFHGAESVRL